MNHKWVIVVYFSNLENLMALKLNEKSYKSDVPDGLKTHKQDGSMMKAKEKVSSPGLKFKR